MTRKLARCYLCAEGQPERLNLLLAYEMVICDVCRDYHEEIKHLTAYSIMKVDPSMFQWTR